ncbi:MAG: universal stress protein [Nocardioidaceae bacterium]
MATDAVEPEEAIRAHAAGPVLVVGFDDSETAWRALHYAFGMARRQHAHVVTVFAQTLGLSCWLPGAEAAVYAAAPEEVARIRTKIRAAANEAGVPVTLVPGTGDPIALLADTALRWRADAIIVGASSSRWHRLLGSVGLRAVRLRRWPVTVVP